MRAGYVITVPIMTFDIYQTNLNCPCKMNKQLLCTLFAFVASVTPLSVQGQELKGDIRAGEQKNALCIGCHGIVGYHASFPEVHKVPKIAGQSAKYISTALAAYKKGERKHPSMRSVADGLTAQDMADLAAYYEAAGAVAGAQPLGKASDGTTKAMELVAKGACASCHGPSLSAPIDPSYPKIAGQHADYLYVALKAYKSERHGMVGRANPVMGGIAKQFTQAELKELANYIGSLPGELLTVQPNRFR